MSSLALLSLFSFIFFFGNPYFTFFFALIFFPLFYEFESISKKKIRYKQIFKILIFQFLILIFLICEMYNLKIIDELSNFLLFLIISLLANGYFFLYYRNLLFFMISNLIVLSFLSLINILLLPNGLYLFLYVVILISIMDTCAYIGGKILGNYKIAPLISKGKTIEGTLIGFFFTILISITIKDLINFNINQAFVMGTLIGLLAFLGDLLESYFKRDIGIKDSGKLIPGHGGLLDRFDGYFVTVPIFNVYLII